MFISLGKIPRYGTLQDMSVTQLCFIMKFYNKTLCCIHLSNGIHNTSGAFVSTWRLFFMYMDSHFKYHDHIIIIMVVPLLMRWCLYIEIPPHLQWLQYQGQYLFVDTFSVFTGLPTSKEFPYLSHPGIPGVTLCFCTSSFAAPAAAAAPQEQTSVKFQSQFKHSH